MIDHIVEASEPRGDAPLGLNTPATPGDAVVGRPHDWYKHRHLVSGQCQNTGPRLNIKRDPTTVLPRKHGTGRRVIAGRDGGYRIVLSNTILVASIAADATHNAIEVGPVLTIVRKGGRESLGLDLCLCVPKAEEYVMVIVG